jgi:lipoprotein NlpI
MWGLTLFASVLLVYSPVWWAGYIWDDDFHLTANPCVVGPLGLKEIWTTHHGSICPLVFTTFWIEHALWGLAPLPYHVVTVLFHAAGAVALWRVLRSLLVPGAWLGAALWALHPLQVESVAWIAEMKNTQSGLFYLLTILFYVKFLRTREGGERTGGRWDYTFTLIFAALAIASKYSTVVLPVVLVLCAWWVESRWQWRRLIRLMPIFFMSAIASGVTFWLGTVEPGVGPQAARSWPERIAMAGDVICFYAGKLIWPHPLMTIYPRWQIDAGRWLAYVPLLAVIVILLALWLKRETWARPCFFALTYFLVVLFPFLGLIDQSFWRYSFVEDHLQYLAGIGPLALAGAGLVWLADFVIPGRRWLRSALGAGLLLLLGLVSWQRCWAYESRESLWTITIGQNPQAWFIYDDLGHIRLNQGRFSEAIELYASALRGDPFDPEAYFSGGIAREAVGDSEGALSDFRRCLTIVPRDRHTDYVHLWIWLIRVQQNQKAEADRELASCLSRQWDATPDAWVTKNADFLLGRIGEEEYLAGAASRDPDADRSQHCEAWYYAGMKRLLTGDKNTANDYFLKCVATGETDFWEYMLAQGKLNTLDPKKR